jgi:hypothetical protein
VSELTVAQAAVRGARLLVRVRARVRVRVRARVRARVRVRVRVKARARVRVRVRVSARLLLPSGRSEDTEPAARSGGAASREAEHRRDDLLWQLRLPDHALLLVQHQRSVPKDARSEARAELLADLGVPRTRDPPGGKADVHVVRHAPTQRFNATGREAASSKREERAVHIADNRVDACGRLERHTWHGRDAEGTRAGGQGEEAGPCEEQHLARCWQLRIEHRRGVKRSTLRQHSATS